MWYDFFFLKVSYFLCVSQWYSSEQNLILPVRQCWLQEKKKKVFSHPCNDLFASHSPSSVWCLSHLLLIFPHLSLNPWTLLRMPGVMQFCFVMWQQIYSSWTSTERPCQSRSAVGPAQASENPKPLGNCLCFVRLDETKQLPWTLGICLSLIYTHSLI